MFQVGKILVQSLIATFGTVAIAANAVCNTLCMLPQIPAQAIGLAMTTVIGQCVGAGDYKQASGYIKKLTWMAFLCNGALCVLMLLGAHLIILPFNLSAETAGRGAEHRPALLHPGGADLGDELHFPQRLRAAGDVKFTMGASMLSMWVFRIGFPTCWPSICRWASTGVWAAMYIDWAVRILCFVARYLSGKWKTKRLV